MPEHATTNQNTASISIASALLSLFWVVFLWNFFDNGPFALGINTSVFLLGLLWISVRLGLQKRSFFSAKNWAWITPLVLISLSFALYDNPFIKITSILALPIFSIVFFAYALLWNRSAARWSTKFAQYALERGASILGMIPKTVQSLIRGLTPKENTKWHKAKRAGIGVVLLVIISATIVAPLLGSADPAFSSVVSAFYAWLGTFISAELVGRIIVFLILLIGLMSWLFSLRQSVREIEHEEERETDSLIAGIVLAGILILYLVFLYLQISRLWVNNLPIDFKETEGLVKSGFWQLFALTILNIAFFFSCYRKTNKTVQRVLLGFGLASLLLLASAAWRMGLYVVFYGFSYEKFYASYTVIFCAILLLWLIWRMFRSSRADLLKTAVFLLLWMYAIIAITPVEQFIVHANIRLSHGSDSRIDLYEMTMLSGDVLGLIEREKTANPEKFDGWQWWIDDAKKLINEKAWYEMNVMNVGYLLWHK
ncbi:MAG: hypothetical protein CO042_02395 [Parcubacteria group bacterium CG_4_9_14_0_2_um_filter_41_8]|nr:MAG: hypothetical protein CO042_02395 [Parcubacteria group bacterium CG_4_9_14_0_2_um_filter_41_8]